MKSIKIIFSYVMFVVSMMFVMQQAYAADKLNINTATVEELQQMSGVGQTRANAIVEYRQQHGPFAQVDDLLEVEGIGESTLNRNREILIVE